MVHKDFHAIDWTTWVPTERATLLFVIRDGETLLIHKKRGLGAGKINAPGGRIEAGESAMACAIREVEEEVRVTPQQVSQRGELFFQFTSGHSIHGYVFKAESCDGDPQETDEATPFWVPLDEIPYDRMWADDRLWVPLLLAGKTFMGKFLFDEDSMLGHDVKSSA